MGAPDYNAGASIIFHHFGKSNSGQPPYGDYIRRLTAQNLRWRDAGCWSRACFKERSL